MFALRTSDEFIFVTDSKGNRVGTYSTRSKIHLAALTQAVGKNVMDLLEFNMGKLIDVKTLQISDPE